MDDTAQNCFAPLIARLPPEIATIKVGVELEFYSKETFTASAVTSECRAAGITLLFLAKESGDGQYEACLPPYDDLPLLVEHITQLKQWLHGHIGADFAAKPIAGQPGSSLHCHVSLHDACGQNLFTPGSIDTNLWLQRALGGLCQTMAEAMIFFAPTEGCYRRYQGIHHTPSHICWGVNNRTAALRIPEPEPQVRRIEHRVPSSIADPQAVLLAIIAGIVCGVRDDLRPPSRLYGNAFDPQYPLAALPLSLTESEAAYAAGRLLPPLLGAS
jgi:glutamine synthetase